MLKVLNIRFFSRTSSLFLRQQVSREPPAPVLTGVQPDALKKEHTFKFPENFTITKLKRNDKQLMQLITLLRNKKKKEHDKQIIVEGNQLIKEAVMAKIKLNKLIFADVDKIKDVLDILGRSTAGVEFIRVPTSDLSFYSVLTTCPGLIAVFDKPEMAAVKFDSFNINVICDNVREPQNIGALIRISNALPIAKMLLPKGSVDPWDTKSIRGSCGSVFHLPIESGLNWEDLMKHDDKDSIVLIADNNIFKYDSHVVMNYDKIPPELLKNKNITLIIGGETQGVSKEALMYAKQKNYRVINIPVDTTVNSLNVATALGIVLFEIRRILLN